MPESRSLQISFERNGQHVAGEVLRKRGFLYRVKMPVRGEGYQLVWVPAWKLDHHLTRAT